MSRWHKSRATLSMSNLVSVKILTAKTQKDQEKNTWLGIVLKLILVLSIFAFRAKCWQERGTVQRVAMKPAVRIMYTHTATVEQKPHLKAIGVHIPESEVAFLKHCNLSMVDRAAFFVFPDGLLKTANTNKIADSMKVNLSDIEAEIILQGLEVFARASRACNFSLYRPSVRDDAFKLIEGGDARSIVDNLPTPMNDSEEARIVFCISAFSDFSHLQELVRAITLPHHLIIVHLERRTPPDFVWQVRSLSSNHTNMLVLQFGSITYPSDSVSHVFLDIMRWVTDDLRLDYDYFMTLGGSAFPLYPAQEMARYLNQDPRRVRIGPMRYGRGNQLCRKRANTFAVIFSRGYGQKKFVVDINDMHKFVLGLNDSKHIPPPGAFMPRGIEQYTMKTNSGNTAAFDRDAVRALVNSERAMEFISRFKQSGTYMKAFQSGHACHRFVTCG